MVIGGYEPTWFLEDDYETNANHTGHFIHTVY